MWGITHNVYLGDRDDARDLSRLTLRGVTHVLNCAEEEPCHFPQQLRYLHLRMKDPDARFAELIPLACDFIDEGARTGGVLVHCSAGVSRSAATALAWLSLREGRELSRVARFLSGRVLTNPDPLFLTQLADYLSTPLDAAGVRRLCDILLGRVREE